MARGRKRKWGVKRTPSGRISQAKNVRQELRDNEAQETERAAMAVALDARARLYGATEKTWKDQKYGSVLGRLCVAGEISHEQFEAGRRWLELRSRYLRALDAPNQPLEPRSTDGPVRACSQCGAGVLCDECRADWADRVTARYEAAMEALIAETVARRDPSVVASLATIVERDQCMFRMVPGLKIALNALARHFSGHAEERVRRGHEQDEQISRTA